MSRKLQVTVGISISFELEDAEVPKDKAEARDYIMGWAEYILETSPPNYTIDKCSRPELED